MALGAVIGQPDGLAKQAEVAQLVEQRFRKP
jgi:hypothetical protein